MTSGTKSPDGIAFCYGDPVPRLCIRCFDLKEPIYLNVRPGEALLLGRTPEPSRVPILQAEELLGYRITPVTLRSACVSGNHAVLLCSSEGMRIWDLGSRNGSWLRLTPKREVAVPTQGDIELELAAVAQRDPLNVGPTDADWSRQSEFANAVTRALRSWLMLLELPVEIKQSQLSNEEASTDSFLLADGTLLRLLNKQATTHEMTLLPAVERIREYVNEQNTRYEQLAGQEEGLIAASRLIREALRQLADAAARSQRVIILGPTGSGKERMARAYHRYSRQHVGPFATLNCALLKGDLLYAQLFGAKKGSFTGAISDVIGVIESAHRGTLFLDELADMSAEVQAALLRFLDSHGEYRALGDPRTRHANVQVVCATNVPLDDPELRHGRFRDDLWYRLAVKVVNIAPLCERPEDVLGYLHSQRLHATQTSVMSALTSEAVEVLLADPWPGNFRDLEHFVERLPAGARPQSVDATACRSLLKEGRGQRRSGRHLSYSDPVTPKPGGPVDLLDVTARAATAFMVDNNGSPQNWGQLQEFIDKFLKPVFIAQTANLGDVEEVGKNVNLSLLARKLNIADGTTVKMHLNRYIERFNPRARTKTTTS